MAIRWRCGFWRNAKKPAATSVLLRGLCDAVKTEATFISGNHDAMVSGVHHLDLADGAVLVTHGDILFHGLSPWSPPGPPAASRAYSGTGGTGKSKEPGTAAGRLQACRPGGGTTRTQAAPPEPEVAQAFQFLYEVWPPWRPLRIIDCWIRTPALADTLAAECRPQSRFVVSDTRTGPVSGG